MKQLMTKMTVPVAVSGLWLMLTCSHLAFGAQEPNARHLDTVPTQTTVATQESNVKVPDATFTSSAFTYQGQLKDANGPVTGTFDFQFILYSTQTGGGQLGVSELKDVALTNGMFNLKLDFGRVPVETKESWLEIGVRQSGSDTYTILFPRQKLTPTPYAIFAQHEQWSLIGVPVGFADQTVIDKVAPVSTTSQIAPSSSVEAKPLVGSETPQEEDLAAKPEQAGGWVKQGSIVTLVDNNDKVGVGTSGPITKFHVRSGTTEVLPPRLESSGTAGFGAGWDFYHGTTGKGFVGVPDRSATLAPGELLLYGGAGTKTSLWAGGLRGVTIGTSGAVGIGTADPVSELHIHGLNPFITLSTATGARAFIQNAGGSLVFKPTGFGVNDAAMVMLANSGNIGIGTATPQAKLEVASGSGDIFRLIGYEPFITFYDSNHGYVRGAIQQVDGGLNLFTDSYLRGANPLGYLRLDNSGNVGIGTATPQAKLDVVGMTRTSVLQITGGADFSEHFDVRSEQIPTVEPGMVVSIDPNNPGQLIVSSQAYDRRVAGIISGAGGVKPGMVMGQAGSIADGAHPVALTGRVYCWVDASFDAVEPGDLLTTSDTPGHAMKVTDHAPAHGAIIGKAMTALKDGKGLVLVLVTLQ